MRIMVIRLTAMLSLTVMILPCFSRAQSSGELTITPVVIDERAKPRDIVKQSLTIVNLGERKLNLYPSVNDVHVVEGEQSFSNALNGDERGASLANWIELSRGVVELGPGEEKTIPFVIRVNVNADPGMYHATISFAEGSTRQDAEAAAPLASVTVNIDVQADVKEALQLNKFFTDNIFFSGDDVLFNYQLENIGNQDLKPKGEIRIYDRSGKEVASVEVNREDKTFSPDQMGQLASVWSAASGFGRYKAFLSVEYGEGQTASVQDTVFFWIIPWQQLIGFSVASAIAVLFLALYVHRTLDARYHARAAVAHAHIPEPAQPVASSRAPVHALLPQEPPSELRRSVSQLFKRTHTEPDAAIVEPAHKPSFREAFAEHAPVSETRVSRETSGGTIDLTKLTPHEARAPRPSHVINLKNPQ